MPKEGLKELCVKPGCDPHRYTLFIALNALIVELESFNINCELWIDGSFVSEKMVPNDVDICLMITSEDYSHLDAEGRSHISFLSKLYHKYLNYLDLFVCIIYPKGAEERELDPPEDYARLWSVEHNERHLKGFVVLEVGNAVL